MSYYAKFTIIALGALLATGPINAAWANVILDGTRVIYPAEKKNITVSATNKNKTPVLIQSWIDNGAKDKVTNKKVPFVLTPPINRIDPGKGQSLRISFTGSPALPLDRESIFWLNVLEVPAKAQNSLENQSKLNIGFVTRIKLFYRPQSLPGSSIKAMEDLRWEIKNNGVTAINNSKYYVSLLSVSYQSGGKKYMIKGETIAPESSEFHAIKEGSVTNINQISYTAVNDYGGYNQFKAKP